MLFLKKEDIIKNFSMREAIDADISWQTTSG